MLLGDLIARLDDDVIAAETLMALDDLALAQLAQDAAADLDIDPGAYVAMAVRRYLNQAPPDEWTTLMSAMDSSGDPAAVLLRRSLSFVLDHGGRACEHGAETAAGDTRSASIW